MAMKRPNVVLVLIGSPSCNIHAVGTLARPTNQAEEDSQDYQLYDVTKGDVEKCTNRVSHLTRHGFGGMGQQAGQRNDGYRIECKDDGRTQAWHLLDGDTDGDEDQQHVEFGVEHDLDYVRPKPFGQRRLQTRLDDVFRLPAAFYDRPRLRVLPYCRRRLIATVFGAGGGLHQCVAAAARRCAENCIIVAGSALGLAYGKHVGVGTSRRAVLAAMRFGSDPGAEAICVR